MKLSNAQISKDLNVVAAGFNDVDFLNEPVEVYRNGSFKIRCLPTKPAILKIAKKYASKRKLTTSHKPHTLAKTTVKQFVIDGEIDNALNYAKVLSETVYFCKSKTEKQLILLDCKEIEPGFVLSRVYYKDAIQPWDVVHLMSGLTCGCSSLNKKDALFKFDSLKDEIEKALLKMNDVDFQKEARIHYGC